MMDKNIVVLDGIIGDDLKWGKSQNAKEFMTCTLCINSFMKEFADGTERSNSQMYIRIFVYDKKLVDYLRAVEVHRGQRASVFGRIISYRNEYKGNSFITNSVVCRDIEIIKNKNESKKDE